MAIPLTKTQVVVKQIARTFFMESVNYKKYNLQKPN